MVIIGIILCFLGVVGAWQGPTDKEYLQDWAVWLFFVILGMIGLVIVIREFM